MLVNKIPSLGPKVGMSDLQHKKSIKTNKSWGVGPAPQRMMADAEAKALSFSTV